MPYLPAVLGAGQIYNNSPLAKSDFYVGDADIVSPYGIEIKFYSITGSFVGMIGNTYDDTPINNVMISTDIMGGVKDFEFTIGRRVEIPFYNQMRCEFFNNGSHWFTGELIFSPGQDRRNVNFKYSGTGYYRYLKDIKINVVYSSGETIKDIIEELINTYISGETPIKYDPDKINPPDLTITKIEFNDKSVYDAIKSLLEICNNDFQTAQYRAGIDKDNFFELLEVNQEVESGFFEGFQYQRPDVETAIDRIINKVNIYRSQENSDNVEYVSSIEDTESQGKYGLREINLTIPDYYDQTDAERLAAAQVERFKDEITSITIDSLEVDENPLDFNFYHINNRLQDYQRLLSECDGLTGWTQNLNNTTLTIDDVNVFSGRKCFKFVTTAASSGDYIEIEFDESFWNPDQIRLYVNQNTVGNIFSIIAYDENGTAAELAIDQLLSTESGDIITTESGNNISIDSQGIGQNIPLSGEWIGQFYDISSIISLKKLRILILASEEVTFRIDRIDLFNESYFRHNLRLVSADYNFSQTSNLINATFGEIPDNAIEKINEINDKSQNTVNIFEKS